MVSRFFLYVIFSQLLFACHTLPENLTDEQVAQELIKKQNAEFPRILKELQDKKKKTSHWVWWVFPTEKAGDLESLPKTFVKLDTAEYLLKNADINSWAQILEEIALVLKAQPGLSPSKAIIPSADHGRIHHALLFWLGPALATTQKYPRFHNALEELSKYKWR